MIDPTAKLSVSRQAIMLGISRGSVYYAPHPVSDADLKLMHRIDKLHMEFPFAGSRMLRGLLVQEGLRSEAARCHADEAHGHRGPLSQAEHVETGTGTQDLSLSTPEAANHPPQSGLDDGHHLHPHGARVHLPGRSAGLVHTARPGTADVDHAGG